MKQKPRTLEGRSFFVDAFPGKDPAAIPKKSLSWARFFSGFLFVQGGLGALALFSINPGENRDHQLCRLGHGVPIGFLNRLGWGSKVLV